MLSVASGGKGGKAAKGVAHRHLGVAASSGPLNILSLCPTLALFAAGLSPRPGQIAEDEKKSNPCKHLK